MKLLNFEKLKQEIVDLLLQRRSLILATSSKNHVTARSVSCVYDGLKIIFFTYKSSKKITQIIENPNVALSRQNISIEGIAKITGNPLNDQNKIFLEKYRAIHPDLLKKYSRGEKDQVVEVTPTLITLFKHEDDVPKLFYLNVKEQTAYSQNFLK